jgi:hypothetical protein
MPFPEGVHDPCILAQILDWLSGGRSIKSYARRQNGARFWWSSRQDADALDTAAAGMARQVA